MDELFVIFYIYHIEGEKIIFTKTKNSDIKNISYKFEIYPHDEAKEFFAINFSQTRKMYNLMLEDKIKHYEENKDNPNYKPLQRTPAYYKNIEEFTYFNQADSFALCNVQLNLERAFKNFFKNKEHFGFPKFKSKKRSKESYTTNVTLDKKSNNSNIRIIKENNITKLKLPKIKEPIIMIQHRKIPDNYRLKSVTISKTKTNRYFASLLFEYELNIIPVQLNEFIGLDYSQTNFYVDSFGNKANYPKFYRSVEKKLSNLQRKFSFKQKDSNNYKKLKLKISKLYEKISNQRKDFLHKQSRQITNVYDCVCIEDLNIQEIASKNNQGKSAYDIGWGMFTVFLNYKLELQGKKLVKVDKYFPSSQLCSKCGYKNTDIKDISIRKWECPICHTEHDRDINAAINIMNEGKRLIFTTA